MKSKEEQWVEDLVDIDTLVPYALNSKVHDEKNIAYLMSSISTQGLHDRILVDKNMVIIAGHGRLEALKRLKRRMVEVRIMTHLDEKGANKARIANNKTTSVEYDSSMLNREIEAAGLTVLDASDIGFDLAEFNNLTMVFDEIDSTAFTKDLNADVDKQTKEAEHDIKKSDLKLVSITNGLGFKVVTVDATRKIARFIASLQEQFDQEDPAAAFVQFVEEMESA